MIERISGKRKAWCAVLKGLCIVSLAVVTALTAFMLLYVLVRGVPYITPQLLFTSPSVLRNTIGILPDILNTIYIVIATLVVVLPIGDARLRAVLLAWDIAYGRCTHACDHESSDDYENDTGEPQDRS